MTLQINKIKFLLLGLLFSPILNYGQDLTPETGGSYFSNTLFLSLFTLIIVLLIVVVVLSQALKNISASDLVVDKFKKVTEEIKSDSVKKATMILFLFSVISSQAANSSSSGSWTVGGLSMSLFYFMLAVILLEIGLIFFICATIVRIIRSDKPVVEAKTKTIFETLNASVDLENEHDILLDHDYDGIKELDNDLPPWWKYGFYITIVIAVIYLINFHVAGTGDLQGVEFEKAMAKAKIEVEEYMKTSANNVDETTIKQLKGADLDAGKELFISTCSACHGKFGQGTVGPNLTDEYWIHGGSLVDVFKSVKYGWVDKGMKSWKEDLSPMQIAQISSFIMTLKGTNPEGAKAPQGDLYKEEKTIAKDSAVVVVDSLVVKPDTLK